MLIIESLRVTWGSVDGSCDIFHRQKISSRWTIARSARFSGRRSNLKASVRNAMLCSVKDQSVISTRYRFTIHQSWKEIISLFAWTRCRSWRHSSRKPKGNRSSGHSVCALPSKRLKEIPEVWRARFNCSRSITASTWCWLSCWKQSFSSKIDTKFLTMNLSSTSGSSFEKSICSSLIRAEPLYLMRFSRWRLSSWSCTWVRCITRALLNRQHHNRRSQKRSVSIETLSLRLYDQGWRESMTNASWEMSTSPQLATQDARNECHLIIKWHSAALSMRQYSLRSFTVFRTFHAHLSLRTFRPLALPPFQSSSFDDH